MTKLLIDTNIYSLVMRGDVAAVAVLRKCLHIGISTISIGELLSGFKGGSHEQQNRQELSFFLDSHRVFVHVIDMGTTEFYTSIMQSLRKKGTPIPTNDVWIASVAFRQGLPLYTKDRHFQEIQGLTLVTDIF